jgi:ubiquinone/menaquinone biosynthesis C-methylase UbiE
MPSSTNGEKHGFAEEGFSWSEHMKYRPAYPPSFWKRIYDCHTQHSNQWSIAHDVGAGAGIASLELTNRFSNIIVSNPNNGYTNIAEQHLTKTFGFPKDKFKFLWEDAEKSSVKDRELDMLVMCEAFH